MKQKAGASCPGTLPPAPAGSTRTATMKSAAPMISAKPVHELNTMLDAVSAIGEVLGLEPTAEFDQVAETLASMPGERIADLLMRYRSDRLNAIAKEDEKRKLA
jgi:hypothetical protein